VIVAASQEVVMAGRKIRSAAEAHACLAAAKAAHGVSPAQWAREHGIDGRSLNAWRVNLGRRREPAPKQQRARLVELIPTPASAPPAARYLVRCGKLAVEIGERFDESTLVRLLRVVAAC
jgi:hypothetical protein